MASSPGDSWGKLRETRRRLELCWNEKLNWSFFPPTLKEGCEQIGKSMNLPPLAILSGYIVVGSYILSPSIVMIDDTDWSEPILVWLTICMPTGSGKSSLFRHLFSILQNVRRKCNVTDDEPSWMFDDASFEKMGALMSENSGRLLGLYDELSAFLAQINLYRGRGLSDSHELAIFLQLYNGHQWRRDTVSGEANFMMNSTNLTVGGFTQPAIARNLIEIPSNSEKGLSHRFIWVFPNPLYQEFSELGKANQTFIQGLEDLLARHWLKPRTATRSFRVSSSCQEFTSYYNGIQETLKAISGMDEFLSGLLSKSRGQVLRVAAVFHILFKLNISDNPNQQESDNSQDKDEAEQEEDNEIIISTSAMKAAVNFVRLSCQQTCFIAGKKNIEEEVTCLTAKSNCEVPAPPVTSDETSTAAYCLLLPGKKLYLKALLDMKKFRKWGNKDGAVAAFYQLEEEGLGKVYEVSNSKGTAVHLEFEKILIPEDTGKKVELAKKLKSHNISLTQYQHVLAQRDIEYMTSIKRKLEKSGDAESDKRQKT